MGALTQITLMSRPAEIQWVGRNVMIDDCPVTVE